MPACIPGKKTKKPMHLAAYCGAANGLLNKKTQQKVKCYCHWQKMLPDWGLLFVELSDGFFLESRPDWGNQSNPDTMRKRCGEMRFDAFRKRQKKETSSRIFQREKTWVVEIRKVPSGTHF